ncbi:hypothetical protein CRG98_023737 [Punica granatum]|uniref:Uncharacterized protein n=1 Tax=Punica granatum TaxID=22663 RepID=A0A2I0JJY2_PUNGR|nr:hypothetical protein CRG98_023737 [Punica granatum]
MDRGKEKVKYDEAEVNQPRPRGRGGRRPRYPSLQEQQRFLWEIPIPRPANRSSLWVRFNADLSSSESSEEFEVGGSSIGSTTGQECEMPPPRSGGPITDDTDGLINSMPSTGQAPEKGGPGSTELHIGQEVSGVIVGEFPRGYYVRLMIGNSEVAYPGVVFKPDSFNPFLEENNRNLNEIPVPSMNSVSAATASAGAGANSQVIGGAINWEVLNVGEQLSEENLASEEALKEAAMRSMKLPENVSDEQVSKIIERVHTKSIGREPLHSAAESNLGAAVAAARLELQDLVKMVQQALAMGCAAPAPDHNVKNESDAESSA